MDTKLSVYSAGGPFFKIGGSGVGGGRATRLILDAT
jgi:hypothetical protein